MTWEDNLIAEHVWTFLAHTRTHLGRTMFPPDLGSGLCNDEIQHRSVSVEDIESVDSHSTEHDVPPA